MSEDDRGNLVDGNKYCVCCLVPGHLMDTCHNKDNVKRICKINNCSKHHHHTMNPHIMFVNPVTTNSPRTPTSYFVPSQSVQSNHSQKSQSKQAQQWSHDSESCCLQEEERPISQSDLLVRKLLVMMKKLVRKFLAQIGIRGDQYKVCI